MRDIDIDFEKL